MVYLGFFRGRFAPVVLALGIARLPTAASTVFSFTGSLATPEDTYSVVLNLAIAGEIDLQTYGFGGGINGNGAIIPAGGFDPFVGLLSGTGPGASFINGTSDILSNFSPGCPPAGTMTVGAVAGQCGDIFFQFTGLAPGTYTVLLSDGSYIPAAAFETPPALLGDGFVDLTGGVFQTCADLSDCNTDTPNWALDITAPDGSPIVMPEPGAFALAALGLSIVVFRSRIYKKGDFRNE